MKGLHPYVAVTRRLQRAKCREVARYDDELQALMHAAWRSKRGPRHHIFPCFQCNGFHLLANGEQQK